MPFVPDTFFLPDDALEQTAKKGRNKCKSSKAGEGAPQPYYYGNGSLEERARNMMEDAAKASNIKLSDVVDEVRISKEGYSYFDVDWSGKRIVHIDEAVFTDTREWQLLEGIHEIIHAQRYDNVLKATNGNIVKAYENYFELKPTGSELYFLEEVSTETFALSRLERYLGNISAKTKSRSNCYVYDYYNDFYETPF